MNWTIEFTAEFEKDKKWYEKKRPGEYLAAMNNLRRYLLQLNAAPNAHSVAAGYIHIEQHGVIALDQRGTKGSDKLQETRLYLFPVEESKMLYIITIGNKDDQPSDIKFCNNFVNSLKQKK
jgi:hypothetical protein